MVDVYLRRRAGVKHNAKVSDIFVRYAVILTAPLALTCAALGGSWNRARAPRQRRGNDAARTSHRAVRSYGEQSTPYHDTIPPWRDFPAPHYGASRHGVAPASTLGATLVP